MHEDRTERAGSEPWSGDHAGAEASTAESWRSVPLAKPEFDGQCRRAFFRVSVRLPIRLGWLTSEEEEELRAELEAPRADWSASSGDELLLATLQRIEEKLDLLLEGRAQAPTPPVGEADMRTAVLSASGLQTTTDEPFRPGDAVKVEMLLPDSPPRVVRALAQVVSGPTRRVDGARQRVALAFESVEEGGRDAIVRYACDAQRRAIRSRAQRPA